MLLQESSERREERGGRREKQPTPLQMTMKKKTATALDIELVNQNAHEYGNWQFEVSFHVTVRSPSNRILTHLLHNILQPCRLSYPEVSETGIAYVY